MAADKTGKPQTPARHWFGQRDVPVLLYRVNRRDLPVLPLAPRPDDFGEHVDMMLRRSGTVQTGRAWRRQWRVGNLERSNGFVIGRIGWQRSDEATTETRFNEAAKQWIDEASPREVTAVAPFAIDIAGRYLGVARHPTFSESILASVFTMLLNDGERDDGQEATDWAVEPVGDESGFLRWVSSVDIVTRVEYVFKLPNPGAEPSFQGLFDDLTAHGAREHREMYKARDGEGLDKEEIAGGEQAREYLAGAATGYGYVKASGQRAGRTRQYDQRRRVARETVEGSPDSWGDVAREVAAVVARFVARRRQT